MDDRRVANPATKKRVIKKKSADLGPRPCVIDIEKETVQNKTYRTALWTGSHLQVTLMSITVDHSIGLERHRGIDQFLRIEQGEALVQMGKNRSDLFSQPAKAGDAIIIPANNWHDVTNIGTVALKIYSIYAPPHHPFGTVEARPSHNTSKTVRTAALSSNRSDKRRDSNKKSNKHSTIKRSSEKSKKRPTTKRATSRKSSRRLSQ